MTKNRDDERPFDAEAYERDAQVGRADVRRDDVADDRHDGDAGIVLHEERLVAGVERAEAGRVEVRKRVVVEDVTITVPVRREVVDVVRVYADGSEEALEVPASTWQPRIDGGTDGTSRTHDHVGANDVYDVEATEGTPSRREESNQDGVVVLHEERPVISSQVYAVERLRFEIGASRGTVTISEPVQREVAEVDDVRADDARQADGERADGGRSRR